MKKRLLTVLAILVISQLAFSQRTAEIAVEFISPADGATLFRNQPFSMNMKITNNGPNTIRKFDTLVFTFTLSGGQVGEPQLERVWDSIQSGEQYIYQWPSYAMGFSSGGDGIPFCVRIEPRNGADPISDPDLSNNTGCSYVNLRMSTSVEESTESALKLYPLPANSQLNVLFASDMIDQTTIRLFDLNGKLLYLTEINNVGKGTIHQLIVSMLPEGIYLIEIANKESIIRRKFSVGF